MASRLACVVWADFSPPSVRHVSHLLRIGGRTCLSTLLDRLHRYFGAKLEYYVVCWDDKTIDQLLAESNWPDIKVFRSDAPSTVAALRNFWSTYPELDAGLVFSANSVLADCELADRMLAKHLRSEADLCFAVDLPPGIGPMFIMGPYASEVLERRFGGSQTIQELARSIVNVATRSLTDQLKIITYQRESDQDPILERLPVSALVEDELSRLSAEKALDEYPESYDALPTYAFKQARIAINRNPPTIRRRIIPYDPPPHTVLFSSVRINFSGAEESLFTLIANLDRSRFRPVAVFPVECMLAEKLELQGISVEIAGWNYMLCSPTNLRYCENLLNAYEPALVHIDTQINPALMVTAHARRINIVGHMRILSEPHLRPEVYFAKRIIAVSDATARYLRRSDLDPNAVVKIYNGFKADQLESSDAEIADIRRRRGIPDDAQVICIVACITETKRLELLLVAALPKIISAVPNAHVVVVGEPHPGSLKYYSSLQAALETSGLKRHVTWWGFENRIGLVYRISDVLAHCNRREPLARCMIEAVSMALPIVGPNDGGTPEIVQQGYNGLLYEPDCADDLAEAVIQVLTDHRLREQMSRAALAVSQNFTIERQVRQVEALYQELLEQNPSERLE